jgi:hypothetical protein
MAYSKVERHMWNDDKFRRFPRDVRQMWQYLLTTEHPLYAVADLSAPDDRWTEGRVLSALGSLAKSGMIAVDFEVRLVLIHKHFKHNHPENPNVVNGALVELAEIPFSETLWQGFLAAMKKYLRLTTKGGEPFCAPWLEFIDGRMAVEGANHKGLECLEQ